MNQRFLQAILARRPDLGVSDNYFFFQPPGDILCGFVPEKGRSIQRIWSFAVPLYDHLDFLHLGFGKIVPVDAGFLRSEPPVAAAETFLQVIARHEAKARSYVDPRNFLRMARAGGKLRNPWAKRAVATTLAFLGEPGEASRWLGDLEKSQAFMEHVPHWVSDLRDLREAFDAGKKSTADLLGR